jgi:peptidyl-prolyl isomerase D
LLSAGELDDGEDGVVLTPDGDPYPRWPQDYPGLASDGWAALAGRLGAAETVRALGNEAYGRAEWSIAASKYDKALRYLEREARRDAECMEEERLWEERAGKLRGPLRLNAAAARMKLRHFREVVDLCSAALEAGGQAALSAAQAAKAHFRRGVAQARLREYAAAEADLVKAAALAPGQAAEAATELAAVRTAATERTARLRAALAQSFAA